MLAQPIQGLLDPFSFCFHGPERIGGVFFQCQANFFDRNCPLPQAQVFILVPVVVMQVDIADLRAQALDPLDDGGDRIAVGMPDIEVDIQVGPVNGVNHIGDQLRIQLEHILQVDAQVGILASQEVMPEFRAAPDPARERARMGDIAMVQDQVPGAKRNRDMIALLEALPGDIPHHGVETAGTEIAETAVHRNRGDFMDGLFVLIKGGWILLKYSRIVKRLNFDPNPKFSAQGSNIMGFAIITDQKLVHLYHLSR